MSAHRFGGPGMGGREFGGRRFGGPAFAMGEHRFPGREHHRFGFRDHDRFASADIGSQVGMESIGLGVL
jgi:hypothetical protein